MPTDKLKNRRQSTDKRKTIQLVCGSAPSINRSRAFLYFFVSFWKAKLDQKTFFQCLQLSGNRRSEEKKSLITDWNTNHIIFGHHRKISASILISIIWLHYHYSIWNDFPFQFLFKPSLISCNSFIYLTLLVRGYFYDVCKNLTERIEV